jgi:hypothetical protein
MTREQPPVRPDPLAEAASRRHELTRSKAIQTCGNSTGRALP